MPGEKIKENGLIINAAFYVDRSVSMGNDINNVFKAVYTISEALKKQFSKEKVVKNIKFRIFAWDNRIQELEFGKKCQVDGGTMPFEQLLGHINDLTKDYMINIIITDGEFSGINENEVIRFVKGLGGIILYISNQSNYTVKNIAKKFEKQLFYITADSNFTIK